MYDPDFHQRMIDNGMKARGGRAVQEIHRANGTGFYDPDFHQRQVDKTMVRGHVRADVW
jgi:hypothetical protein